MRVTCSFSNCTCISQLIISKVEVVAVKVVSAVDDLASVSSNDRKGERALDAIITYTQWHQLTLSTV